MPQAAQDRRRELVIRRRDSCEKGSLILGIIIATGAGSPTPGTGKDILDVGGDSIENLDPTARFDGLCFPQISDSTFAPNFLGKLLVTVEFFTLFKKEITGGIQFDGTLTLDILSICDIYDMV